MPSLSRLNQGFAARVRKLVATVGHADLTAEAGSQVIALGTLPAGSRVLGVRIALATAFTGGGAGSVTVDVGSTGDADALVDGANLFAASADGECSSITAGVAPNKGFAAATVINGTFAADVDVDDLTAGACTIEVLYAVADL
jgi:hypothetical protein